MKTIGIVAEYNPFHKGHQYLIDSARAAGYTHVVAVMSGNFVQRCTPAITEKRIRAHAALLAGVDLVLELPLPYATATAQRFALGAVGILRATGCVDALAFGSELGDTAPLVDIVDVVNSPAFSPLLKESLAEGHTFAKARSLTIGALLGERSAEISRHPNNLLGIEYISATKRLGWSPRFFTIPRQGVGHHSQTPQGSFASATFLRQQETNWKDIAPYVPSPLLPLYQKAEADGLYPSQFSLLEGSLLSHLRRLTIDDLSRLPDISEGLEHRFYSAIRSARSLEELMTTLKTKRYPLSRIRRLILTAYLGITKEDVLTAPPYLRLVGATKKGKELLFHMKQRASLPLSHSLSLLEKSSRSASRFAFLESLSTDLYSLCLPSSSPCGTDYTTPGVFLG